ncbi:hypothetical protein P9112_007995 [Eukaryota sp. TZLM1-RC]
MDATHLFEDDIVFWGDICDALGYWIHVHTRTQPDFDDSEAPATLEQIEILLDKTIHEHLFADLSPLRIQAILFGQENCRIVEILFQVCELPSSASKLQTLCLRNIRMIIDLCNSIDSQTSSKLSFMLSRSLVKIDSLRRLCALAGALPSSSDYPDEIKAAALETLSFAICSHQVSLQSISSSDILSPLTNLLSNSENLASFPIRKWATVVLSVTGAHRPSDLIACPTVIPTLLTASHLDPSEEVRSLCLDAISLIIAGVPSCIKSLTEDHSIHNFIRDRLTLECSSQPLTSLLNMVEKLLTSTGAVTTYTSNDRSFIVSANDSFVSSFVQHRSWTAIANLVEKNSNVSIQTLAIRCIRLLVQVSPPSFRFGYTVVSYFQLLSSLLTVSADQPSTPDLVLRRVEASLCVAWIVASDRFALEKLSSSLVPFSIWADNVGRSLITSLLLLDPSSLKGMLLRDAGGARLNGLGIGSLNLESDLVSNYVVIGQFGDLTRVRTMDLAGRILEGVQAIPVEEGQIFDPEGHNVDVSPVTSIDPSPSPHPEWDNKLTFAILLRSLAMAVAPKGVSAIEMIQAAKQRKSLVNRSQQEKPEVKQSPGQFRFGLSSPSLYTGQTTLSSPLGTGQTPLKVSEGNVFGYKSPRVSPKTARKSPKTSPFKPTKPFSPSITVRRGLNDSYLFDKFSDRGLLAFEGKNSDTIDKGTLEFCLNREELTKQKLEEMVIERGKIILKLKKEKLLCPIQPSTREKRGLINKYLTLANKQEQLLSKLIGLVESKGDDITKAAVDQFNDYITMDNISKFGKLLANLNESDVVNLENSGEEHREQVEKTVEESHQESVGEQPSFEYKKEEDKKEEDKKEEDKEGEDEGDKQEGQNDDVSNDVTDYDPKEHAEEPIEDKVVENVVEE